MKISLTRLQREEIFHKLDIVSNEPDLLETYGVTEQEVRALLNVFRDGRSPAIEVYFHDQYVDMIIGELENVIEIADSNIEYGQEAQEWTGLKRSMLNAIKKLKG